MIEMGDKVWSIHFLEFRSKVLRIVDSEKSAEGMWVELDLLHMTKFLSHKFILNNNFTHFDLTMTRLKTKETKMILNLDR